MISRQRISRRSLVQGLSLLGVSAAGFPALPAFASDDDDYKALVCVILRGGLDNFDSVIPADMAGYNAWAKYRGSLLAQYTASEQTTRDRAALLPLRGEGAESHALVPEMAPLSELYARGRMALVANVGPLIEPVTRANLAANRDLRPPRLASHSDQYAMWSTLNLEGTNVGWGGSFLDRMEGVSPYSSVSFSGVEAFGQGRDINQVALNGPRVAKIPGMDRAPGGRKRPIDEALREHFTGESSRFDDALLRDIAREQSLAVQQAVFIRAVIDGNPEGEVVKISGNKLSEQLAAVMSMVRARSYHRAKRQVFVVSMPGFDTHKNEASSLPPLQAQLAEALARFDAALEKKGDGDKVTTFTVSDFGRTLAANASGTDHGWGGHHFVVGGAVKGGRVVGELTPPALDHDQAWAKRGGLIPTIAIEQYGAALGRWFGVPASDLGAVFPNLGRFDANAVDIFGA